MPIIGERYQKEYLIAEMMTAEEYVQEKSVFFGKNNHPLNAHGII